jgi:hypothetical protein
MPVTPEQFAKEYLPVAFTACKPNEAGEIRDGTSDQVYIRKYLNANFRYKKAGALPYEAGKGMPWTEMKDALLGFVLERASKAKAGFLLFGGSLVYSFFPNPDIAVYLSVFQHAFDGKCTPAEVRDVLRLFTYWHGVDKVVSNRWANAQAFADQCLGLDCNGFVGSFFKTQYPGLGIGPETAISSYETRKNAKVRTSLAEIESLDALVFPGYAHIALIGAVGQKTSTAVRCTVCQSTGTGLNGLQTTEETITFANGKFKLAASEVKAIVKVKG